MLSQSGRITSNTNSASMNGDSYSSRTMASANALPRIRKHETDTNNPIGADSGRYGSSRDHYVGSRNADPIPTG